MRLAVLNSGSKANGYVLYNDTEALIVECGCPYSTCLQAIGFDRKKIVGAIITHEHKDHCGYVDQYLHAAVKVYSSIGTRDAIKYKGSDKTFGIRPQVPTKIGGFTVVGFDTEHDCAEPFGYLIHHEEMGTCVFATDTYYLKYKFEGLSQVMLECNYDDDIINDNVNRGVIHPSVRERVYKSHMSLATTISTLQANELSKVQNILLIHLSSHNSNPTLFKDRVEVATGHLVTIAKKGIDIPFNKNL